MSGVIRLIVARVGWGEAPDFRLRRATTGPEHSHATGEVKPQQDRHDAAEGAVEHVEVHEVHRVNQEQSYARPDQKRRAQRAKPEIGEFCGWARGQPLDHEQPVEEHEARNDGNSRANARSLPQSRERDLAAGIFSLIASGFMDRRILHPGHLPQ